MSGQYVIGIDVGGTKCAFGLYEFRSALSLVKHVHYPTNASRGFAAIVEDILGMIEEWRTPDLRAIGIGVPGLIRRQDGSIYRLPNIPGGERFPLSAFLRERTTVPVAIGNDSQTFTLAEAREGAGKGHRTVVGITMGTGVGGGIVMDGKLFFGAHGFAGEVGHTLLAPGHPPFVTDDRRGDAEQFLSGTAQQKRTGDQIPSLIREAAILCANITYVVDPSIIVFGGSAGRALQPHLPAIAEELKRWTLPETPLPALAIRKLEDAATRGAAMLALQK